MLVGIEVQVPKRARGSAGLGGRENPVRAGEFGHDQTASALGADQTAEHSIGHADHGRKHGRRLDVGGSDLESAREHYNHFSVLELDPPKLISLRTRLTVKEARGHMNTKVLLGFLGGLLAATGVFYIQSHRSAKVEPAPAVAAAPAATPVPVPEAPPLPELAKPQAEPAKPQAESVEPKAVMPPAKKKVLSK